MQLFLPLTFLLISLATTTKTTNAQSPVTAPSPFSSSMPPMPDVMSPSSSAAPMPDVMSPSSSAAPMPAGPDCTDSLLNMSSCVTYVEDGSKLTMPEKGCCGELASLVDNQPVCLCQLLASGETFGIKIDTVKSLKLPTVCKVQTPPVSLCSDLGIPVASPMAPAPAPGSGGPIEPSSGPAASTSDTPTAAPPSKSSANSITKHTSFIALIVIALSTMAIF